MKYAYYPGCSLASTGIEYQMSTLETAKILGIDLWEIPEWNCCGASSGHLTDHLLSLALPARNMAIAEDEGLDVAIPCASCYARCKASELAVNNSSEMRQTIEEVIERKYEGRAKARSLLDIMANDVDHQVIRDNVTRPLEGIRAVCYYGCLLVRPQENGFDDPEDPRSMDRLTQALGAETVDWPHKTECCGASHPTTKNPVGLKMLDHLLSAVKESGANCIVTACPMCFNNLDMRQREVEKMAMQKYNLPVFYFTELMGLAFGAEAKKLGLNKHFVDAMPLVNQVIKATGKGETA